MATLYGKITPLVCLTLLLLCAGCHCDSRHRAVARGKIATPLHNGDVVFRRGSGAVSHAVIMANNEGSYSHVGIAMHTDSGWCVVHEVPYEGTNLEDDKIYCDPIDQFFAPQRAITGAIYRYNGLDSLTTHQIVHYLTLHLAQQTPFDHDYDLTDDSRQYCSELVWRAYLSADIDISEGRRTDINVPSLGGIYILPTDIESNKNLQLLYHF